MKNLNIIILLLIFILLVFFVFYTGKKEASKRNEILNNNIYFKGKVTNIKTSNNHAFGIIFLDIDSCNVKDFEKQPTEGIYPYKIKGNRAEIYINIPDGISNGDEVVLNSNKKMVYFSYVQSNQQFEDGIGVVNDPIDIDYVKTNTSFK